LEESAFLDQGLELLTGQEGVVLVLTRPRLPRGPGDRIDEVAVELEQAADQRVLADPGRPRDDDQQALLQASDSQNAAKSRGGGASKFISEPVRGCRSRSRHACNIGRTRLASRPPYSESPATG